MDDLLDLNWSSPSSTTASKPLAPSLQPSKPKATGTAAPGSSSFDFLAKSATASSSRTGTPNYYQSSTPRTTTPQAPAQALPQPKAPVAGNGNSNGDAFSSLLGMGSSATSKNLTMAQKQAQIIEERRLKEEREKAQFAGLGTWEQFNTSSTPSSSSSSRMTVPLQPVPTKSQHAFDGLLQPTIPRSSSSTPSRGPTPVQVKSSGKGTFWDNDDFLAGPSKASSSGTSNPIIPVALPQVADPWDFDQLAAVEPVRTNGNGNGNGNGRSSGMRTPEPDFDFGEWKDMDEGRGQSSKSGSSRLAEPEPRREAKPRSSSPPPHIVGQIVEMGFSPAQARTALARTSTGVDVQAALDALLGEAFGSRQPAEGEELDEDDDYIERERIRRETEEKEEKRRRRRQGPSRDTIAPRSRDERERENGRSGTGTPIQADMILAQASEIGQSVFTKATSLWNTGKEKALKAYEEQKKVYEAQLAAGAGGVKERGKGPVKDGRPRWMVEREEEGEIGGARAAVEKDGGFRDDSDEEEVEVARPKVMTNGNGHGTEAGSSRSSKSTGQDRMIPSGREENLFGDDPLPPRTSNRRPEPPRSRPLPPRTATPPPLPSRTLIPADPSALQSSSSHKTKGNEHFKLGRFTEAESSYSTAISILPNGHLYLIPLYNNRAATRIKLGESSGAAQDSSSVIEIIGHSYHPSKEASLPATMSEIKLADSFVKAYTKRAQAWEMGEKWSKAVEDWEKVLGFDSVMLGGSASQIRNLAAEGLRRSKQMLDGPPASTSNTSSKPVSTSRPTPKPTVRSSKPAQVERSEAVFTLRAAAKVQEQEDQQRLQLKDVTESRINTWKSGKETNLRALLASLDTVLWDDVLAGGLKVGMHELITEKQVKIKYMKVIARLHPDKLDVKKTTVEQRMLANGAFGTLNEAWQAFNDA